MAQFWSFLRVYGALLGCAAALVGFVWLCVYCVQRMRKLEARVDRMQEELDAKLTALAEEARTDAYKQRRILNESLSNLSESLSRAVGLRATRGQKEEPRA